jgi:hypothetical protein
VLLQVRWQQQQQQGRACSINCTASPQS